MMKEETTIPKVPKRVKGTVLFTVVSVMMVMVVMLTATLALATTANNRAMNNYNQAQTQAAAKAAVESILAAMQNDGPLASDANSITSGGKIPIDNVAFYNESSLGSMGRLKDAAIEYYGTKYILDNDPESENYGKMEEATVLKVWATVEQGGQDSTYCAYVMNGSHNGGGGGGGGGFVTTGTAVNGTKTSAYGGTYIGYDNGGAGASMWAQNDNTVYETPFCVNGDFRQQTGIDFVIRCKKQGITVWGNYYLGNGDMGIATVNANSSKDFSSQLSYIELPYFYVDGVLASGTASTFKYNGFDVPLNVFCGQMVLNKDTDLSNVNTYCYTPYDGTSLTAQFEKSDGSYQTEGFTKGLSEFNAPNFGALYNWSVSVFDVNDSGIILTSGNYYTKGNLKIASNNAKFARDVYVDGDMEITGGNCWVGGDVYVAGTLKGNITLNGGTVFCDNIQGTVNGGNSSGMRAGVDPSKTVPGHAEPKPGYTTNEYGATYHSSYPVNAWGSTQYFQAIEYGGEVLWWMNWGELLDAANNPVADGTVLDPNGVYKHNGSQLPKNQICHVEVTDPYGNPADPSDATTWVKTSFYASDGTYLPLPYGNPIEAETFFPEEYEKEVVTGITTINSLSKEKTQIVQTVQDVMKSDVNPYNTEYMIPVTYLSEMNAHQYNLNNPSTWDSGISHTGNEYIITNSCRIQGNVGSARVTFKVPANEVFWVEVVGNGLHFNNDGCLRQDTSSADVQPTLPSDLPGELNILLNANTDMSNPNASDMSFAANNTNVPIATTYIESLLQSGAEFQLYTDASYAIDGIPTIKKIPISIYSTKNPVAGSVEACHRLWIDNAAMISANICAPYTDLIINSTSFKLNNNVYYNGFPIKEGNYANTGTKLDTLSVLGCCNVANLRAQANDFVLLYVPCIKPPRFASDEDVMKNWKIQFYENY